MAKATAIEDMRNVDPAEDSFGFCPDFDNSAIYFAFRR
jgi:hypothetical protein